MSLTCVTYNAGQGKYNPTGLGTLLRKLNPDIICFQEFNSKVGEQAKLSNYELVSPSGRQGFYKNVVYTKLSVLDTVQLDTDGLARNVIGIKVKVGGKDVYIFNLHLSSGRDKEAERQKQLHNILKETCRYPKVIIVGDFNLNNQELDWTKSNNLLKGWQLAPLVPTYCFDNICVKSPFKFNHPFDRCLFKGLKMTSQPEILGHGGDFSDHYGVLYSLNSTVRQSVKSVKPATTAPKPATARQSAKPTPSRQTAKPATKRQTAKPSTTKQTRKPTPKKEGSFCVVM